jgi:hypothetical protein
MASPAPRPRDATQEWPGPEGARLRLAEASAIEAGGLKAFFAYWTARAGGRIAPKRADIEPRDMAALLPHVHLYDVIDAGRTFRVRVLGTAIVAVLGGEQTGRILSDSDADLPARRAVAIMRRIVEGRIPLIVTAPRIASTKPTVLSVEALWLPLSEDGQSVSQVVACSIASGPA